MGLGFADGLCACLGRIPSAVAGLAPRVVRCTGGERTMPDLPRDPAKLARWAKVDCLRDRAVANLFGEGLPFGLSPLLGLRVVWKAGDAMDTRLNRGATL